MGYLVTGSKGFIGRNLISYMNRKGIEYSTDLPKKNTHTIIHLSAATNVRESIKEPKINFDRNALYTFKWLQLARDYNIPNFIFTSSMGVVEPKSPYLASKIAGEAYCTAFKNSYNLNTYITRLSNVYGPCSEYKDSIIAKYIKAAINKEDFYIYGNGAQTRDFVYVEDVIRSLLNLKIPFTQITSGYIISINELIYRLSKLSDEFLGRSPIIRNKQSNVGEINIVNLTKGIHNPTKLSIGLRKTFKWFVEHL